MKRTDRMTGIWGGGDTRLPNSQPKSWHDYILYHSFFPGRRSTLSKQANRLTKYCLLQQRNWHFTHHNWHRSDCVAYITRSNNNVGRKKTNIERTERLGGKVWSVVWRLNWRPSLQNWCVWETGNFPWHQDWQTLRCLHRCDNVSRRGLRLQRQCGATKDALWQMFITDRSSYS